MNSVHKLSWKITKQCKVVTVKYFLGMMCMVFGFLGITCTWALIPGNRILSV